MMGLFKFPPAFKLDDKGSSTVEFAIISSAFLMMVIGGMYLSMLGYTASSLHYAVEAAARCQSINTTACTSASTTQTYATSRFTNLTGKTASFVASAATCGHQVTGTITFTINKGTASLGIPLSATACFP